MKNLLKRFRLARELKRIARERATKSGTAKGREPASLSILDDVVFKTVLGSDNEDSREALRSLLSACTGREISKVQVCNGELVPTHLGGKTTRLDVHVSFNDGESADLEMQASMTNDDLKARAEFYTAMLLSGQRAKGKPYRGIKRVYQIFFLNYVLFPGDKLPRLYQYREETEGDRLSEITEIIFYELPKLRRRFDDFIAGRNGTETLTEDEKWCLYMKYRHDEEADTLVACLCQEEEGIMRAEKAATRVSRDYERYARKMAEIKNSMDRAQFILEAREEGLAKGHEEGLAKGHEKGLAEGREEGQMKIIEFLKSGKSPEEIIREFEGPKV